MSTTYPLIKDVVCAEFLQNKIQKLQERSVTNNPKIEFIVNKIKTNITIVNGVFKWL